MLISITGGAWRVRNENGQPVDPNTISLEFGRSLTSPVKSTTFTLALAGIFSSSKSSHEPLTAPSNISRLKTTRSVKDSNLFGGVNAIGTKPQSGYNSSKHLDIGQCCEIAFMIFFHFCLDAQVAVSERMNYASCFVLHMWVMMEGENGLFQSVLLKEVVIEPNAKLECVPKFCYLGDTLGTGGGVEEVARARVRCAWAKFKELSPILTARGASYRIKGKI